MSVPARRIGLVLFAALSCASSCFFAAKAAFADRIAVIALASPGHPEPAEQADRLAAELLAKGHRVISSPDARLRLSSGDQAAGPDWAAQTTQALAAARAALTRLDRTFASTVIRRVRDDIARQGGGAGGAQVLAEWALLERALSRTAGDDHGAREWLKEAAALGPELELDPVIHPNDERDQFAREVVTLRRFPPAALAVQSTPPGADVWVDGVHRCSTPCSASLLGGRHFVRVSTPAHAPAVFALDLTPGATATRTIGLSSAYAGASLAAVSAMLADPSRRGEAATALEPIGRFLDVDHVVAVTPESNGTYRVAIAPPPSGTAPRGLSSTAVVPASSLVTSVVAELEPSEPSGSTGPSGTEGPPWYKSPGYWFAGAGLVGAAIAGILLVRASRSPTSGNLVVTSP